MTVSVLNPVEPLNDLLVHKNCWDWEWEIVFFRLLPMATQTYVTDLQAMNPTAVQVGGLGRLDSCTSPSSCGLGFHTHQAWTCGLPFLTCLLKTCQIRLVNSPFFWHTIFHSDKFQESLNHFPITSCDGDLRFGRSVVNAWSVLPLLSNSWCKVHEWKFGHYIFVSLCNFLKELECT